MKNLKNILAGLVLVTVMGVSSTFGGVYIMDRNVAGEEGTVCVNENGGIMISSFTGIMISSFTGVLLGDFTGIMISSNTATDAPPPCEEKE